MCNLYSITTNQEAIARLFRVVNRYVWKPRAHDRGASRLPSSGDPQHRHGHRYRNDAIGPASAPATGGPPVTNIRNTSAPHWRMWLRCLVPFNSVAEYAPKPNPKTKKKDVVWFALNEDRLLTAFAGIWTTFRVIVE
jgi:putative SOS response-associated peptidase YedK